MTFRPSRIHASAFAATLLAACGGGGTSESDFVNQYAAAFCSKLISCCNGTAGLPTQAACVSEVALEEQSGFAAAQADSNVSYDSSAASACVSELNAESCGGSFYANAALAPDCDKVFVGTVADGGACHTASNGSAPNECKSGLCDNVTYSGTVGTGTCIEPGAVGAACASVTGEPDGSICAAGSFEDESSGSCVCTATEANGADCTDEGSEQCSSGYCDSTTNPSAPVCATPPATLSASTCAELVSGGSSRGRRF